MALFSVNFIVLNHFFNKNAIITLIVTKLSENFFFIKNRQQKESEK